MKVETCAIPGLRIVTPHRTGDERGFFSEVFNRATLVQNAIAEDWIQDNHSLSRRAGVVRGLHWQGPPHAQAKLVRVVRGAILDVAVDIRRGSPTYGQHLAIELSAQNWRQLYVPIGFAHGFCTLTDETEVLYKVSAGYAPHCEGGLMWNDPALGIEWPVVENAVTLSERDRRWTAWETLQSPFVYAAQ